MVLVLIIIHNITFVIIMKVKPYNYRRYIGNSVYGIYIVGVDLLSMTMSVTRVELEHLSWSPFRTSPEWTRSTRVTTLGPEQSHVLELSDLYNTFFFCIILFINVHRQGNTK